MAIQHEDVLTKLTHRELGASLRRTLPDMPSRGILLLVAQIAVETGMRACHCFNIGNVKSHPGDGRDFVYFACGEELELGVAKAELAKHPTLVEFRGEPYVRDGKTMQSVWLEPPHPWTRFRAFGSLDGGVLDFVSVLRLPRYAQAWAALPGADIERFAAGLYKGGYHTGGPKAYLAGLQREFTRSRGIFRGRPTLRVERTATYSEHAEFWQEKVLGWSLPERDGRFGPATEKATRAWQNAHDLLNDGEVGPMSWATAFPAVEVEV